MTGTQNVKQYQGDDGLFKVACRLAENVPTQRQFRKWCQKRGKAFSKQLQAKLILGVKG